MTQLDVLVDTLFRCVKRYLKLNSTDAQILLMKQQANDLTGPLAGLRVLEIEAIGPVTWAGMMLSDLGAQVLRVDRPAETEISQGFSPRNVGATRSFLISRPSKVLILYWDLSRMLTF